MPRLSKLAFLGALILAITSAVAVIPLKSFAQHAGLDLLQLATAKGFRFAEPRNAELTWAETLLGTSNRFSAAAIKDGTAWGTIELEWGDALLVPVPDRWYTGEQMRTEDRQSITDDLMVGVMTDSDGNEVARHYYLVDDDWRLSWKFAGDYDEARAKEAEQLLLDLDDLAHGRTVLAAPLTYRQRLGFFRELLVFDLGDFLSGALARLSYHAGFYLPTDLLLLISYSLRDLALALWLPLAALVPSPELGTALTALQAALVLVSVYFAYRWLFGAGFGRRT